MKSDDAFLAAWEKTLARKGDTPAIFDTSGQVSRTFRDIDDKALSFETEIGTVAGQVHPLHTHTSDVKSVVVSGTFMVGPEGGPEKKLGPGSYFFVPGRMKHTSTCAAGADCVLFQETSGKFDMKPVAEKGDKPAADKPATKKE